MVGFFPTSHSLPKLAVTKPLVKARYNHNMCIRWGHPQQRPCARANIDQVFFCPFIPADTLRWCLFFSVRRCFFNNQATVWQEPAVKKALEAKMLTNMPLCVCVPVCSPTDRTLYILLKGETDMTLSCLCTGRISSPQPKDCCTQVVDVRKTTSDYSLCSCVSHFPPLVSPWFFSINEAPNEQPR